MGTDNICFHEICEKISDAVSGTMEMPGPVFLER